MQPQIAPATSPDDRRHPRIALEARITMASQSNFWTGLTENLSEGLALIEAKKLRVLALTSQKRMPQLPDLPTAAEVGYKVEAGTIRGFAFTAGVPAEATPVMDGVWRYVDAQGKAWQYQETPAGLMKTEEVQAKAGVAPTGVAMAEKRPDAVLELISVKEEGELLRFSRPGPFGQYSWVKKKTELDADERVVWARARAKSGQGK